MIAGHLQSLGCELHLQRFFLRPYMQPIAGLFFLLAGALCFVLASKRRYWAALAVALVIPAVYVAEFEFNVPIVTWAGGAQGLPRAGVCGRIGPRHASPGIWGRSARTGRPPEPRSPR